MRIQIKVITPNRAIPYQVMTRNNSMAATLVLVSKLGEPARGAVLSDGIQSYPSNSPKYAIEFHITQGRIQIDRRIFMRTRDSTERRAVNPMDIRADAKALFAYTHILTSEWTEIERARDPRSSLKTLNTFNRTIQSTLSDMLVRELTGMPLLSIFLRTEVDGVRIAFTQLQLMPGEIEATPIFPNTHAQDIRKGPLLQLMCCAR